MKIKAFRASIIHFLGDPGDDIKSANTQYFDDGILVIRDGYVDQVGHTAELLPQLTDIQIKDYSGKLIMPGFVDTHIHYVQTDIIAAYGEHLLEWLETYTFPAEREFSDPQHAKEVADFFIEQLISNGTTSALVLGSVHKTSADAIFEASHAQGMRMMAGKVMMDRNCPEFLQDTPESSYRDSKELIEKWHHHDRLLYAITPRFAPTSTPEQLQLAGQLANEHSDAFMHTHVAENKGEVAWVAELFPKSRSYLDVYDHYGLLRERSVLAHCIYLDEDDQKRMAESGAAASFCPTSNLFLGSGLFDLQRSSEMGIRVGVGTDVGAGTSFSMLQTLNESYKVSQMAGYKQSAYRSFYLATLGGAESLYIEDKVGNLEPGKEADFIVINFDSTPLVKRRMEKTRDIAEKLFALQILGDDRSISATYVMGNAVYQTADEPGVQGR